MKNVFLVLALFVTSSLFAQKKANDFAKFNTEEVDFGKIKQNVPVTATYIVTNISKEPLIIDQALPSCGCSVSDYTKAPIAPGKTGFVKVTYNAADLGPIGKQVTVKFANAPDVKFLKFKGEVVKELPASQAADKK